MAETENLNLPTKEQFENEIEEAQKTSLLKKMFPIHKSEYYRLVILLIMFGLIAAFYSFLREFKDVVTSTVFEVQCVNWLRIGSFILSLYFVSFIQTLVFSANMDVAFKNISMVFSIIMVGIAALLSIRDYIQPRPGFTEKLFVGGFAAMRGFQFLQFPVMCFNYYVLAVFYILCDTVGSLAVSYLFFTWVNSHLSENQNKRFIRPLYAASNILAFFTSSLKKYIVNNICTRSYSTLTVVYVLVTLFAAAFYFCLRFIQSWFLQTLETQIYIAEEKPVKKSGGKKKKPSFKESMESVFSSSFIASNAGLVLFYSITAHFLSVFSKHSYKAYALASNQVVSSVNSTLKTRETHIVSILVLVIMFSPLSKLIDIFGVFFTGSFPLFSSLISVILLTLLAQSNLEYYKVTESGAMFSLLSIKRDLTYIEAMAACLSNASIKLTKYAFFDIVKEAVAMRLDPADRVFVKGVCDGSAVKLGKLMGAVLDIIVGACFSAGTSIRYYSPIIMVLNTAMCAVWFTSLVVINRFYKESLSSGSYIPAMPVKTIKA